MEACFIYKWRKASALGLLNYVFSLHKYAMKYMRKAHSMEHARTWMHLYAYKIV